MYENIILRRDGSYVVDRNGYPYHVPNEGEFTDLWAKVDAYAKENPGKVTQETPPPEPTLEELAAQEQQQAQAAAAQIIQTAIQQQAVQTMSFAPAAFTVLAKAGLFEEWTPGTAYTQGQRFVHQGIVYEAQQAVTAQAHQFPGGAGMLAVYRPISADPDSGVEPDGSRDNPMPFLNGMDVSTGLYYAFEGKVWLAKADMRPCIWNPGTVGMWQWEAVG